jgi:hypothetical protein
MSEINETLKNKFGIDRKVKSTKQDKWLRAHLSIEEDLLLQQKLVETKQKTIEEQSKPLEEKSLSKDDTKKLDAFSKLIKSFGVEIEPEINENIKPVVVLQTPVDIIEAVKLVKDKNLPTQEETIEETQQLIADVVNNLKEIP